MMNTVVKTSLVEKLHPMRYPKMSAKMAAIVGYILGEKFTEPEIVHLVVTSDGFVMAGNTNDILADTFIGDYNSLIDDLDRLISVADLTQDEEEMFRHLVENKIANR